MSKRTDPCRSLAIAAVLLAGLACGRPLQVRYEEELEATALPARHAVHGERLRDTMRRLKLTSVERLPKEMDAAAEQLQRAEAVAAVAQEMARAAEEIPQALAGVEMSEAARRDFLRLAAELRESALALARDAPRLPPDEVEARWHDVKVTCGECHSRFRILPRAP